MGGWSGLSKIMSKLRAALSRLSLKGGATKSKTGLCVALIGYLLNEGLAL